TPRSSAARSLRAPGLRYPWSGLLGLGGMHDQHVAARLPGDALADAPAEEAFEQSGLARADDDQVGACLLGDVDDLGRRLPDDAGELVRDARRVEQPRDVVAVTLPELRVRAQPELGRVRVIRAVAEVTGRFLNRHGHRDVGDDHLRA